MRAKEPMVIYPDYPIGPVPPIAMPRPLRIYSPLVAQHTMEDPTRFTNPRPCTQAKMEMLLLVTHFTTCTKWVK